MSINLVAVEDRLREKICPTCMRFTAQRRCSLPPSRPCAIFGNLPTIVDIVRKIHAPSIGPYLEAVRDGICTVCREGNHESCPRRDGLDCALDCYLPIIVDEVEAELEHLRRQRGVRSSASQ